MPALREVIIDDLDATPVGLDALHKALLRSIASRPQSVRKTIGVRMKLYSFVVSKALGRKEDSTFGARRALGLPRRPARP